MCRADIDLSRCCGRRKFGFLRRCRVCRVLDIYDQRGLGWSEDLCGLGLVAKEPSDRY